MRVWAVGVLVWIAAGGAAYAQSASTSFDRGFGMAVAQSSFGSSTSQSYGGEFGFRIKPRLIGFLEIGQVNDTAPSSLGTSAQAIASFVGRTQNNVGYSASQPILFGVAGVRYTFPGQSQKLEPYVLGGAGIARVKRDVTFTVGGTDVTGSMGNYGVVLGSDLSGQETRPMVSLGGGVAWKAWQHLIIDFEYRYGYIWTGGQGTNLNRAGVGFGVWF